MELGVQDVMRDARFLEHPGDLLRDLDGDRTDQDRLPLLISFPDCVHDSAEFFFLCLVNSVLLIDTDDGTVGGNLDDIHAVDLTELALLRQGCTGHAALFVEFIEKVLEGDRRKGPALTLDLDVLLCLDRLVQTVGVTASGHNTAGELIDATIRTWSSLTM